MSHIQGSDYTINDVYDFAYDIAQEFEKIVLLYGIDKVKPLVDKVINVLEILESSIQRNELLAAELGDVKSNNLHLSSEKIVNDHEKSKLKQIFEENEESWLQEVIDLKTQLSTLKSENVLLRNHLAVKKESCSKSDDSLQSVIENQEDIIHRLQCDLKQKEKQLQDHVCNINALNSRIQELIEMNKILHFKNQEAKNDISKLVVEKNDYKSELILQKKENLLLNESIDELIQSIFNKQKDCLPANSCEYVDGESLPKDTDHCMRQELKLLEKIQRLQAELQSARLKSLQCEDNIIELNSDQNKKPISKIHQFFHLFLGITTLSEFCWF